jgi:DNA-directed RNA polymerase specialized sigma subunit
MPKNTNPLTACADQRWPHVNLRELSDEDLCKNAQSGCVASKDLLWHRHIDFIESIVYRENKHQHLPQHEIADALQELYFAFHTTLQRYDPANHCHGKPASFKTFLRVIIAHEFSKYCTLHRIYHKHIVVHFDERAVHFFRLEAKEAWHYSDEDKNGNGDLKIDREGILFSEISSDCLADTLCRLKSKEKKLIEIWLHYGRDKTVAKILGISPNAAKLRRERLFCRIRQNVIRK